MNGVTPPFPYIRDMQKNNFYLSYLLYLRFLNHITIQNTKKVNNFSFSVRKRIVPLQPLQIIKGDKNWCTVPGGVAGSPCSGGYKYGGLAVKVGVGLQAENLSH